MAKKDHPSFGLSTTPHSNVIDARKAFMKRNTERSYADPESLEQETTAPIEPLIKSKRGLPAKDEMSEDVYAHAVDLMTLIWDPEVSEVLIQELDHVIFKTDEGRFWANKISFPNHAVLAQIINLVFLPYAETDEQVGEDNPILDTFLEIPALDNNDPAIRLRIHVIWKPYLETPVVVIVKARN